MTQSIGIRITGDSSILVGEVSRAEKSLGRMTQSMEHAERASATLTAGLGRVAQVVATALSAGQLMQAADAWSTVNAQLKIATGSAQAGAAAYGDVVRIAMQTGQAVGLVSDVYRRFSENAEVLNLSQARVAAVTQTVAQAIALSGGSAAASEAALTQFGQALASGQLRGEELNSVLEQSPRLARALADGLGVPIGQLRTMAAEGKLTSDVIVDALGKSAGKIAAEFAQLPPTIGRAMTNLQTAFTDTVGSFEKGTGAFAAVAGVIDGAARSMDLLAGAATTLGAVYLGRTVSALITGAQAKLAATAATRAAAGAELQAAEAAVASASAHATLSSVYGAGTAAANALAAANTRLTAAQAGVAAASRGAMVLGALGGPIGIVTTALTLGASAWLMWRDRTKEATADAAQAAADHIDSIIGKLNEMNGRLAETSRTAYDNTVKAAESSLKTVRAEVTNLQNRLDSLDSAGGAGRYSTEGKALQEQLNRAARQEIDLQNELAAARQRASQVGSAALERFVATNAVGAEKVSVQQTKLLNEFAQGIAQTGGVLDLSNAAHRRAFDALQAGLEDAAKGQKKTNNDLQQTLKARLDIIKDSSQRELDLIKARVQAGALTEYEGAVQSSAIRERYYADLYAAQEALLAATRDQGERAQIMGEMAKTAIAWSTAEQTAVIDAAAAWQKSADAFVEAIGKQNATLDEAIAKSKEELAAIGLSAAEKDKLRAASYDLQAAQASEAAAVYETARAWSQLNDDAAGVEFYASAQAAAEERAAKLRELATLERDKAAKQSVVETREAGEKAADDIGRALTDALMRGFQDGRGFMENFANVTRAAFNTMVLRPIIDPIVNTAKLALLSAAGLSPTAQAAGASGSAATTINAAGALNNLYDGITNSFSSLGNTVGAYASYAQTASGYTYGTAAGSQQSMMLAAQDAGFTTTAGASTLGTAASYLGGALAGYALGKMISGGYSVIGKSGNTAVAVGTAIGAIWGPLGAAIGGAIGGLINRAFGMGPKKVTAYGVTGTFGDGDFEGKQFQKWKQEGGWFRSDKKGTNYSALAASADYALSMSFRTLQDSTIAYAEAIGLGTSAIEAYTKKIEINLKGLSDEEKQAKWDELFATMGNEMAALAGNITAFAHAGETSGQVLERLATNLTAVNAVMDSLGDNAFAVSLKGAGLASQLVDLVGGLEAFSNLTGAYYQNFYTSTEQFDAAVESMRDTLIEIGVSAMPKTREAFRALMEAQDLTTVSGQATYAALLQVSGGFAQLIGNIENQIAQLEAERLRLAQQILDEHDNLLSRAAELTGNTAARLSIALADVDPLNRSLYLYVDALERARSATESISASFDALAEAGGSIASFVQGIRQSLLGLASGASLAGTRAAYRADLERARRGDVTASNSITGTAQAYLDAARSQSGSRAEYAAAVARVAAELEALPATKSYAQQQVELLQQLNAGASQIEQAVASLQSALGDAMAAGFGQLDINTNGLLTFEELRAGLSGIATDAQLRALIAAADINADGQISKLEAQAAATSAVADNTAGMPLDAQEQINELRRLVGETITNSGRIVELNVSLQALRNAIVDMTEQERVQAAINNKNLELEALARLQEGMVTSVLAGIDSIWATAAANKVYLNADAGAALKKNTAIFNVVDGTFVSDYDQITGSAANMDAFKAAFYAAGGAYDQTYGMADDLLALKAKIDAARQAIIDLGGVPAFARGINEVPADMLAQIHAGERILPAADNRDLLAALEERNRLQRISFVAPLPQPAARPDDALLRELLAELRALRAQQSNSAAESRSTALATSKLARLIDRLTPDGDALAVRAVA